MINNVNETLIGKKVRFVGKPTSEFYELFCPDYDAIGTITDVCGGDIEVEWPKGSVLNDGAFWYTKNELELVEEMTNEEIWEMLRPKMIKNGLEEYKGGFYLNDLIVPVGYVYTADKANEAIAIAYRSGYLRAMKGRPFKIGEKKKKGGHWVPVDPDSLPKEGMKVRYKGGIRGCNWEQNSIAKWIKTENDRFSIKFDGMSWTFDCMNCLLKYFDMWVEDDE